MEKRTETPEEFKKALESSPLVDSNDYRMHALRLAHVHAVELVDRLKTAILLFEESGLLTGGLIKPSMQETEHIFELLKDIDV